MMMMARYVKAKVESTNNKLRTQGLIKGSRTELKNLDGRLVKASDQASQQERIIYGQVRGSYDI